jgi:hypothetical protein
MEMSAKNIEIQGPVEAGCARSVGLHWVSNLQKKLIRVALIAALDLISVYGVCVSDIAAGSFSTVVHMNAVVLERTQLKALLQPATLVVTEADVQQGYVDVNGTSLFEIWNNSSAGCVLIFESSDFPFQEADVFIMGREIIVYPTGGMVIIPVKGRQQIALDYRFVLSSKAQPGTYAWPLHVSVNTR